MISKTLCKTTLFPHSWEKDWKREREKQQAEGKQPLWTWLPITLNTQYLSLTALPRTGWQSTFWRRSSKNFYQFLFWVRASGTPTSTLGHYSSVLFCPCPHWEIDDKMPSVAPHVPTLSQLQSWNWEGHLKNMAPVSKSSTAMQLSS